MRLVDRQAECGNLDGLVEAVRAGQSRALVLSGEDGVGKSALPSRRRCRTCDHMLLIVGVYRSSRIVTLRDQAEVQRA